MLNDFYRSKEWIAFRQVVIAERTNDEGDVICEHCGGVILRAYDIIAHHKIALTERNYRDANVALNPENIMLVHHVCHNQIHNKLGFTEKQVFLVWGSPFSGKSSWVDESKSFGDLVVDMDSIWQCVSGCDRYIKPSRLKDVVFGIHAELLAMVRMRRGSWNNAYVVGGYPLISERERLLRTLGAREVYIETDLEECLYRLEKCNDGRDRSEWKKYIEEWWDKYSPHLYKK